MQTGTANTLFFEGVNYNGEQLTWTSTGTTTPPDIYWYCAKPITKILTTVVVKRDPEVEPNFNIRGE